MKSGVGEEWGKGGGRRRKGRNVPCRDQACGTTMAMLERGHFLLSPGLAQGALNRLPLQKGEKINVAVKTCKKDCTLDNKEKFLSEAGMCPLGNDTTPVSGKRPLGPHGPPRWEKGLEPWMGRVQTAQGPPSGGISLPISPSWESPACFPYCTLEPLWPIPLAPNVSDHEESRPPAYREVDRHH